MVARLFAALYEAVAAHSRLGLDVVVDVGHHDAYSRPLGILPACARRLAGLPVLFVGVHCPIEVILARRAADPERGRTRYETSAPGEPVPPTVLAWEAVHDPGLYDLELDTSRLTPEACAARIAEALRDGPPAPSAFDRLAASGDDLRRRRRRGGVAAAEQLALSSRDGDTAHPGHRRSRLCGAVGDTLSDAPPTEGAFCHCTIGRRS